jgi:arylsulfatase A-like enzyme
MAQQRRPNILVFMTDHQRADTVLPEHPCIMPNVETLGREGVVFDQTFCTAPHCCPSRASFHSGLHPSRSGVWNNVNNGQALSRGLAEGVRCWSEDLASSGYALYHSGKWHVSAVEDPSDRGWQELSVFAGKHSTDLDFWRRHYRRVYEAEGVGSGDRRRGFIRRPGWGDVPVYGGDQREMFHELDRGFVDKAVEFLEGPQREEEPWVLYVGLNSPHDAYTAPDRFLSWYDDVRIGLPPSYADEMHDKPALYRRMRDQVFGQLSEDEVREAIRHYWADCSYIDELFGRVLGALDASGQADDTVVLFCSDHGDYLGEHGLFLKGIPAFDGAYHVPFVVRWPAGIAGPGSRVGELVSLTDWAPTVLELAGVSFSDDRFAGRSLSPFLRGDVPRDWRDHLVMQCDGVELYASQRTVRTREWKYVFNGFDFDELYHIAEDPHEMVNLAASSDHPDVVYDMSRKLWDFAFTHGDSVMEAQYITTGFFPYGPAVHFADRP